MPGGFWTCHSQYEEVGWTWCYSECSDVCVQPQWGPGRCCGYYWWLHSYWPSQSRSVLRWFGSTYIGSMWARDSAKSIYLVCLNKDLITVSSASTGRHYIFREIEYFAATPSWYRQTNEERQHNNELQRQRRHFSKPRHRPKRHRVRDQGQRIGSLKVISNKASILISMDSRVGGNPLKDSARRGECR